jgi:hypothetical protein
MIVVFLEPITPPNQVLALNLEELVPLPTHGQQALSWAAEKIPVVWVDGYGTWLDPATGKQLFASVTVL